MNKICTDISQSKKLMELGIDVNTADMLWVEDCDHNFDLEVRVNIVESYNPDNLTIIPCWSLTALLGLLPFHIISNNQRYAFGIFKGLNKEGETYMLRYNIFNTEIALFETDYYNNPIDACVEMVVWLKEKGKL